MINKELIEDNFEERAAIFEFEAGYRKEQAESLARMDVCRFFNPDKCPKLDREIRSIVQGRPNSGI